MKFTDLGDNGPEFKLQGVAEGLPQTLRKVVPGYAKREIDKKMDDQKFGRTDVDKDANYYRYKKIQDKLKEQGVAEGHDSEDLANEVYAEFERIYPNLARRVHERTIHAAIMDVLNYGGDNDPGALAQDVARAVKQQMQQGVAEGSEDNDTAKAAYMYGLRHGLEGVGNNMDRAQAEWGDNFKYYNAGFLKGRNEKAKSLKAVGQGYGNKQQGVAEGEQRMSRAAMGHEKYGKEGMQALAKAGREGASEKTLDAIRDKHNKYDESIEEAEKKGLYYYVNKRKKAGTSRDADSPKAPTAQAWKDAAKTAKESVSEEFNGEYDDEAGMAKSNLRTMARAVNGLLDTIDNGENLPEWAQEKIAKAEMMTTGVWDYLLSQEEQGIDPQVDEASLAAMRDYFNQADNNSVGVDNEYGTPERTKSSTSVPAQIQTLINKMYHIGKITPQEFETLKNFQAKTGINVGLKIKEAGANPYAVGMAQAMKSTGDKPPLKKSTITKAHKIARAIEKGE